MAARPITRSVSRIFQQIQIRPPSVTQTAKFPSPDLTQAKHLGNNIPTKRSSISVSVNSSEPLIRQFHTCCELYASRDTSSIDFAFLPDIARHNLAENVEEPQAVPLLYSGLRAQAAHEDESKDSLRPLINLISSSSTQVQSLSPMSEIHQTSSLDSDESLSIGKKVMSEGQTVTDLAKEKVEETVGDFKHFLNGVLDDLFGPKNKKS